MSKMFFMVLFYLNSSFLLAAEEDIVKATKLQCGNVNKTNTICLIRVKSSDHFYISSAVNSRETRYVRMQEKNIDETDDVEKKEYVGYSIAQDEKEKTIVERKYELKLKTTDYKSASKAKTTATLLVDGDAYDDFSFEKPE